MTVYKYDIKKGFTTGSGRALSPTLKVGLSRTGKSVVVYNSKGRVVGRVANAKESGFFKYRQPDGSYNYNQEESAEGVDDPRKLINYHGAAGDTWYEFQEDHVRVWGYEYH